MQFDGVRGDNRRDFLGRIRSKAVQPGVYVLTLTSVSSRLPVAKPLLVQIVSPRRTILLDDSLKLGAACEYRQSAAGTRDAGSLVAPFRPPSQPSSSARPDGATIVPTTEQPKGNGVLGIGLPSLPDPGAVPHQASWALVILLALVLFGLPLAAVSVLGVQHLRRRRIA
jgi:hypothetical protein